MFDVSVVESLVNQECNICWLQRVDDSLSSVVCSWVGL